MASKYSPFFRFLLRDTWDLLYFLLMCTWWWCFYIILVDEIRGKRVYFVDVLHLIPSLLPLLINIFSNGLIHYFYVKFFLLFCIYCVFKNTKISKVLYHLGCIFTDKRKCVSLYKRKLCFITLIHCKLYWLLWKKFTLTNFCMILAIQSW